MTRYYYNENPQVTLWREKYEEQKHWKVYWKSETLFTEKRMIDAFKRFNSLPWYKKMFYKFGV